MAADFPYMVHILFASPLQLVFEGKYHAGITGLTENWWSKYHWSHHSKLNFCYEIFAFTWMLLICPKHPWRTGIPPMVPTHPNDNRSPNSTIHTVPPHKVLIIAKGMWIGFSSVYMASKFLCSKCKCASMGLILWYDGNRFSISSSCSNGAWTPGVMDLPLGLTKIMLFFFSQIRLGLGG